MRKTTRVLAMMIVALAGLFSSAVLAAQLFPDQENLVTLSAGWSAVHLAPIGQEFVPQRSSLDAVELTLANTDTSWPFPADVEVNIRADSITGPLLGTSLRITLPFGTSGVAHFDFASSVRLTAGQTHVIEIVTFPGGGNVGVSGGWTESYQAGRAIIQGQPIPASDNSDLWFREGTTNRGRHHGQ